MSLNPVRSLHRFPISPRILAISMLYNIALWLHVNSTPLFFTAFVIQLICCLASGKGRSPLSIMIPNNISLLMLIVLEAERYASGATIGGVMVIAWGYILCRDNLACYRQIRRGWVAKRTQPIAKQTMELLSRLFSAGMISELDSQTTNAKERPLVEALQASLVLTPVLKNAGLWRLYSTNVPGVPAENLGLWVVSGSDSPSDPKEGDAVKVRRFSLRFHYQPDGKVEDVSIEGQRVCEGHLVRIPATENRDAYWAVR